MISTLLGGIAAFAFGLAVQAAAPFMIIRFNQENVYFEEPLVQAVKAALAVKPQAEFTIVSFAPSGQSPEINARHINAVEYVIRSSGVPMRHIHIQRNMNAALKSDELHLLVE